LAKEMRKLHSEYELTEADIVALPVNGVAIGDMGHG
jgi:hypothetical protein